MYIYILTGWFPSVIGKLAGRSAFSWTTNILPPTHLSCKLQNIIMAESKPSCINGADSFASKVQKAQDEYHSDSEDGFVGEDYFYSQRELDTKILQHPDWVPPKKSHTKFSRFESGNPGSSRKVALTGLKLAIHQPKSADVAPSTSPSSPPPQTMLSRVLSFTINSSGASASSTVETKGSN